MDVQTLFFAIALSSGVFGVLLIAMERWTPRDDRLAFMAFGFLLLSAGAWLQVARGVIPPWLSIGVGNAVALVGLSYQLWTVLAVTGRPIPQRVRIGGIVALCGLTAVAVALPAPWPSVVASAVYGSIFAAAAVALLTWTGGKRVVRSLVAALFLADAALYAWRAADVLTGAPPVLFTSQGRPRAAVCRCPLPCTRCCCSRRSPPDSVCCCSSSANPMSASSARWRNSPPLWGLCPPGC